MRAGALALALPLLLAWPAGARANEDAGTPNWVEVHGFVSQGAIKSTGSNYLADSKRGSFEFSEVGINFTKSLVDRLRIGAQLFARDLGPIGNYSSKFDWYYLDYRFRDWLGLRAGRIKLPFGLYNELNDIDSARVPILLPQSMYTATSRDFLLAATGFELYGFVPLGRGGALEYRLYAGTIFVDVINRPGNATQVARIGNPYVVGGRLIWETPLAGLRAAASFQALRFDIDAIYSPAVAAQLVMSGTAPAGFTGAVGIRLPAILTAGSLEYAAHDLSVAAEYGIWRADIQTTPNVAILEPTSERARLSERMHVMGAYRVRSWLWPGLYYSLFFPRMDRRTPRDAHQHDLAATLRFDVTTNWLVKLEAHYMRGTAALDSTLNGGAPLATLDPQWVVLLAKTTVSF